MKQWPMQVGAANLSGPRRGSGGLMGDRGPSCCSSSWLSVGMWRYVRSMYIHIRNL